MHTPRPVNPNLPELPDRLAAGLELVSVGLNPSIPSARSGVPFANPRNRFWRALVASGLAPEWAGPSREAVARLLAERRLGFTDVARRPTPGAAGLRAGDFRAGAPALEEKLVRFRPRVAWFHGKLAWRAFLKHARGRPERDVACEWGLQPERIGPVLVWVTPNPSPANAAYSLADLVAAYAALKAFLDDRADATGDPDGGANERGI